MTMLLFTIYTKLLADSEVVVNVQWTGRTPSRPLPTMATDIRHYSGI